MNDDFSSWVQEFRNDALASGISAHTFDMAFRGVEPNQRVIDLDGKQPERSKMGFSTYLKNVLNQKRIDTGRQKFIDHQGQLALVQNQYGVPSQIITALWGVETSYGVNTGGYDLIVALSTLAWEGRRAQFFRNELLQALQILEGGHVTRENFKGSWAGAMGQCQFMPSSWNKFAVDGNGDGHKDIFTTKADVFASTANYLARSGWDSSIKWGWAVKLPRHYAPKHMRKSVTEWIKEGVKFSSGMPNIEAHTVLTLVVPDGGEGRAYLVSKNFDVIKTWNRSTYFALTVGLLSDLIAAHPVKTTHSLRPHLNP